MMQKNSNGYLFLIAGFVFGIAFIFLVKKYSHLSLENTISFEINPFEFLTILVNGVLAYYVTSSLGKKIDLEKNEKQYIIDYLQEFRIEFSSSVQSIIDNNQFDSAVAKIKLKFLRKKNSLIINVLKTNFFITDNDQDAHNLKPKISLIWSYLTNEEKDTFGRVDKINIIRNEIDEIIFKLIFKINKK